MKKAILWALVVALWVVSSFEFYDAAVSRPAKTSASPVEWRVIGEVTVDRQSRLWDFVVRTPGASLNATMACNGLRDVEFYFAGDYQVCGPPREE